MIAAFICVRIISSLHWQLFLYLTAMAQGYGCRLATAFHLIP
jgi:hypothetical protein